MSDKKSQTRLIIARHGNTFGPGDVVTRVGGRTDLPLVESGLQQGYELGLYLKNTHNIPDIIYTSTLKRAIQTAEKAQQAMGLNIPSEPLTIFNEIDYGLDENKPETEVTARLGEAALKAWDSDGLVPDGWLVDPKAMIDNWRLFAQNLLQNNMGRTVLVVTSNGVARFAPYLTHDIQAFKQKHSLKIATGGVCVFSSDGKDWVCDGWNIKPKEHIN